MQIRSYHPIKKLVHFEIHYKSKELANKEKDEVNDNGVETNKGHKSDMKSTRISVIKEQYKSRLRDKYG